MLEHQERCDAKGAELSTTSHQQGHRHPASGSCTHRGAPKSHRVGIQTLSRRCKVLSLSLMLFPFLLHPLPAPPAPPATLRIHPLPALGCLLHLAAEGSTALLLVLLLPQAERRCEQVCGYLSPQLTPEPLTMGWKLAPGDEQLKGGGRERCGSAGGKGSGMPAPPPDFQMNLEVYEEKANAVFYCWEKPCLGHTSAFSPVMVGVWYLVAQPVMLK